jgi:hypothetical protein
MERFLGPYTLKQVKDAYGRMEFGLQDEVAGSLRQWVAFDDFESIRKHYPIRLGCKLAFHSGQLNLAD